MSDKKLALTMIVLFFLLIFLGITYNVIDSKIHGGIKEEYLIKEKINSVVIEYYPQYNIATAEALNSLKNETYVDKITINVEGTKKDKMIGFLSTLEKSTFNEKECMSKFDGCLHVIDNYEIKLNNTIKLSMGYEMGSYNNISFDISKEFNDLVNEIINEYETKFLYKDLTSNNISIKKRNGNIEYNLGDKEIEKVLSYKYFLVHDSEPYETFDGGYSYQMKLDNDVNLYLFSSFLAYLQSPKTNSYIILNSQDNKTLYDYINELYEKNVEK